MTTAKRKPIGFRDVHFSRCLYLLIGFFLTSSAFGQYWMELKSPAQASPCVDYPVEVTLYNDGADKTTLSRFELSLPSGLSYIAGSVDAVSEADITNLGAPQFTIPEIEQCESITFLVWLSHECINRAEEKEISGVWEASPTLQPMALSNIRFFGLSMRIYDLNVYYDSTDLSFKKRFSLINTGQIPLTSFTFYVEGQDNMDIVGTNLGQLSSNGDTLIFGAADFGQIGNGNTTLDPGEEIMIINDIDLDACREALPFVHRMVVPCGRNVCEFEVESDTELKVTIGDPFLVVLQQDDQTANPCDSGIVRLKLTNRSFNGSFPQGNALFNLTLNPGWSSIQNNQRTEPRRDACLRIVEANIMGQNIPIRTQGFSGYGLDFTRLTSDPDGPGGLSDIDGDGRYDDLFAGDTICLEIRYVLNRSCLSISCNGTVFSSRILRMESTYDDYCDDSEEGSIYLSRHNYYWAGTGGGFGGLNGVYVDGDHDTLNVTVSKSISGFLNDCPNDSAVVRIDFPSVVDIPSGAIIVVNNRDTVDYLFQGQRLTIFSDTGRMRIQIPIVVTCDPGAGGSIQTACSFCLGSGFPKHQISMEVDYFCDDQCYGRIPFICAQSSEFVSVCDSASAGIISEGKFVLEEMLLERRSLGYEDASKSTRIVQGNDSMNLDALAVFDTFRLEIPFDIRCDANYRNAVFKLIQNSVITYNVNDRDTSKYFEFFTDTLKLYDGETGTWSVCDNALGNEFFNTRNDGYRNNYVSEVNISQLGCLNGGFTTLDSLVFIIYGRVKNTLRSNVRRVRIRNDLSYSQDGCQQESRQQLLFNAYSGTPNSGSIYLTQPYQKDTSYKQYFSELSVCGDFELNINLDNIYYYTDSLDPFAHEHRQLYNIKNVKVVIPDFFQIDTLPYNYYSEFYHTSKGEFSRDTLKLPYSIRDSLSYHIVTFAPPSQKDFKAVRHYYRLNLIPNCYGTMSDSIFVEKHFEIQQQSSSLIPRDTIYEQYLPLNIAGLDPIFEDRRHQFLYDSMVVLDFNLRNGVDGHVPDNYFDFHHTWLDLSYLGNMRIDSLVERTDNIRRIWNPLSINSTHLVYVLDSTFGHRDFTLYGKIENCLKDTLHFNFHNSCEGYPSDWLHQDEVCERMKSTEKVYILPEVPDLQIKFISTPDSAQTSPCDTFEYVIEVRNSDLGHLSDHELVVGQIEGMNYLDGEIEYPSNIVTALTAPTSVGNTLRFDLSDLFEPLGFKGFYSPGENVYEVTIRFVGDCGIEDGAVISVEALGRDLCDESNSSGRISSPPLSFTPDSLFEAQDLYDLKLTFRGDTLCGEQFIMRGALLSKSSETMTPGQRIRITYEKELSFLPASFSPIHNVGNTVLGHGIYDGYEQILLEVPDGVGIGDSLVFECTFERTCIGVCKPTSLNLDLLQPQEIECPSEPTGRCALSINTQSWSYDSLVVAPHYVILNGQGQIIRKDQKEILNGSFEIKNLSPFGIQSDIVVAFYEDVNYNGLLDGNDRLIFKDTVSGKPVEAFKTSQFNFGKEWPNEAGCHWLAHITPEDNPCICQTDTFALLPFEIEPQKDTVFDCYSNLIEIGFDSIQGYTYKWNDPQIIGSDSHSLSMYHFIGSIDKANSLWDTVVVTSTRLGGCSVVDSVFILLYRPEGQIQIEDSIACHGGMDGALNAELNHSQGVITYQWSNGDTLQRIDGLTTGNYLVVLTDELGCRDSVTAFLPEPEPIEDSLFVDVNYNGFPIKCHGDSTGSVVVNVEGGSRPYEYYHDSIQIGSGHLQGLSAGWTKIVVVDRNGCRSTDSIFLEEPPPIEIISSGTKAGCDEDHLASAQASASGGVGIFTYEWANGARGDSIGGLDVGLHRVRAIDANGCWIEDTIEVIRHDDPGISVNLLDTLIQYGEIIRLHAQSNASNGRFFWLPAEKMSCDTCPTTNVSTLENLVVEVLVIDENGCEAWEEIIIRVEITKRVWAPNAITVNGDGVNDGFTLFGNKTLERIETLHIYDRWGELVFYKEDFIPGDPSLGWPGILNGSTMNPAVFVWLAEVRFVDGEKRKLYGDVTVIR